MITLSEWVLLISSMIVPGFLIIVYGVYQDNGWRPVWIGAFGMIVSQIVLRLPLLNLLFSIPECARFFEQVPFVYGLLTSFLGAFFACGIGWLFLKFFLGRATGFMDAIGYGLGFSFLESTLFSGLSVLNVLMGQSAAPSMGDVPILWWTALEKLSFLLIYMMVFVLVWMAVKKKKPLFWLEGFGLYFVSLFVGTLLLGVLNLGYALCEIILLLVAIGSGWYLWKEYRRYFPKKAPAPKV